MGGELEKLCRSLSCVLCVLFLVGCGSSASDPPIRLTAVLPATRSITLNPTVKGTANGFTSVRFFSDDQCTAPLSPERSTNIFESVGIAIESGLNPNTDTTLYAKGFNENGTISDCLFLATYTHDDVKPEIVSIVRSGSGNPALSGGTAKFLVTFSEPIDSASFRSCDIRNVDRVNRVPWAIKDLGDQKTFIISTPGAGGTIQPIIKENSVRDLAGNRISAPTSSLSQSIYVAVPTSTYFSLRRGDVNLDGKTNAVDLSLVESSSKKGTGTSATRCEGDVTGDGLIDTNDTALISTYLQTSAPVEKLVKNSDINFDGTVDSSDLILIANSLSSPPENIDFCSGDITRDGFINEDDYAAYTDQEGSSSPVPPEFSPGDVDFNGVVDSDDLFLITPNIGKTGTWCDGDVDGDGLITTQDALQVYSVAIDGATPLPPVKRYLGDLNLDGKIDLADAALISMSKFVSGNTANWCEGDSNSDGKVDATDLNALYAHLVIEPEAPDDDAITTSCPIANEPQPEEAVSYSPPEYCDATSDNLVITKLGYKNFLVAPGATCESGYQTRTCDNGVYTDWTGSFKARECHVLTRSSTGLTQIDLPAVASHYGKSVPQYLVDEFNRYRPAEFSLTDLKVFSSFLPNVSASWSTNYLSQFNFTGIAWSQVEGGTLINQQHMAHAGHWQMGSGTTITFYQLDGTPITRTVTETKGGPNDIAIAKLDSPVPSSVFSYPVLKPYTDVDQLSHDLTNAPLAYINNNFLSRQDSERRQIHWNKLLLFADGTNGYMSDEYILGGDKEDVPSFMNLHVILGDSGKGTFLIVEGIPVLIFTFHGGGGGRGPFYGGASNQEAILELFSEMNP